MIKLSFLFLAASAGMFMTQDNWGEAFYVSVIALLIYFNLIQLAYSTKLQKLLIEAAEMLKGNSRG